MPQLLCKVPKGLLTREKKRTMLREIIEARINMPDLTPASSTW